MVKVEIDDAVRAYALDYSQRVMATCADVEKNWRNLGHSLLITMIGMIKVQ